MSAFRMRWPLFSFHDEVNESDYLKRLRGAIKDLHECNSVYLETVPVVASADGRTHWNGEVQVFRLVNHPEAELCYAWSRKDGEGELFYVFLGVPPISSPIAAVQSAIATYGKLVDAPELFSQTPTNVHQDVTYLP